MRQVNKLANLMKLLTVRRVSLLLAPLVIASLWLLPQAIGSLAIAGLVMLCLLIATLWGWRTRQWRPLILLSTFAVLIDLFGLAQLVPVAAGLVIAGLWLAGLWLVGHIGQDQPRIFHQALTSFLVVEIFLVLQLWPINVLSKAVIVVAFALFLWYEFVRVVSPVQRLRESVLPFLLIVALMTLTARWIAY